MSEFYHELALMFYRTTHVHSARYMVWLRVSEVPCSHGTMQCKACVTNHSSQTSFCPEAPANCQSTSSHAPEITITATLLMSNLSQTIFYRMTHTHSAVHAMARCVCPFVCHTSVLYQYICTYHPPRNECHVFTLVFWWQRSWWIFNSRHSPRWRRIHAE